MQPGKKTPRPEDRSVGTGARRQKFLPPVVYTPDQTGAPALDEGACHSLLALLLRAPSNILILRGPEHRIKLANSRSSKSGDIGALAGKPFRKALPDLAAQGVLAKLDQAYQTGIPFIGESVQAALDRCGDGILAPAYFKLVFQPTHSRSGSIDGLLIFGGENTEMGEVRQQHEQLERLVEERANQLSTIIETITDHVVVYDVEGNGVLMNSAAREYFARALSPATQAQPLFERVKQQLILDDRGSLENSLDLLSRIFQGGNALR